MSFSSLRCVTSDRGRGWLFRPAAAEHLGVLTSYFLLALLVTYPLVLGARAGIPLDPQIKGWFPGDGDPWHYLWGIWYAGRALSTFPPPLLWTDLVFFPMGFEIPFLPGVGLILGPAVILLPVLGLVLTYNLLWWVSFALAGYTMYLLARHLVGDRIVAFVCGGLFTFSSYRLIHSVEHLPIMMASFLVPLFALTLLRAEQQPTRGRLVSCALVLAASAGVSWYCMVSLLVYLGIVAAVLLWQRGLGALRVVHLAPALLALAVFLVAVAPFVLPLVLSPSRDDIVDRPLAESSEYSADLLAFFVPSPRNPLFGGLTGGLYERFTGNPYEQTVYLGYVLLALAIVGVLSSRTSAARLFRVSAATAFVLALGPFLHIAGQFQFEVGGKALTIQLPYLMLRYVPFVRGARVASRFVELLLLSLIVLAGYGLAKACGRLGVRGRAWLAAAVMIAALLETTQGRVPVMSTQAPAVYAEIGRSPEMGTVLELPLDWRIIKYHYYQTVHGKRMVVGNPVRLRQKYTEYPDGMPLVPFLKDPKLLVGAPDPENSRRDAERLAAFFDVRYVVIHGEYLDPRVSERLDRFVSDNFPHVGRRSEGTVVAYTLRRPDAARGIWPQRYVIDFGEPFHDFALLTGWGSHERWEGGPTFQWTSDRESSIVLCFDAPVGRVLELRMRPMVYPNSPAQTVSVEVNGQHQGVLTLGPDWAVYRLPLAASSFRRGVNTLTFRYGYALAPASVIVGTADTRTLGVAFDFLAITPGP